jgi:hypothetical protein
MERERPTTSRGTVSEGIERSIMRYYWIGTVTGDKFLSADGHFIGGNYELKIEGQQPYIAFYKGSQSHQVGMFVLKNITGWLEITEREYKSKTPQSVLCDGGQPLINR